MATDPSSLSPRDAVRRYIDRRSTELTEESQESYRYRLKLFVDWCDDQDVTEVGDFSGWLFDQYQAYRGGQDIAASTIHNEMETLAGFIEYLESIDAVEGGLHEKVNIPKVPQGERSRDKKLATVDARALLTYYRNSDDDYGSRGHAFLELAWHTGARVGGIRALDLRDFYPEEGVVDFVHRPTTGTPLKKKVNGERVVAIREPVADAVAAYIENERPDVHDQHGRQPLFGSTRGGRPVPSTLRIWCYQATQPCLHSPCPHGYERPTCEYTKYTYASNCPSSRSPHHVRTGSITWHRNRGVPKEVTKERTNASEDTIDEFYDKSTKRERMELRRRPHLEKLDIEDND